MSFFQKRIKTFRKYRRKKAQKQCKKEKGCEGRKRQKYLYQSKKEELKRNKRENKYETNGLKVKTPVGVLIHRLQISLIIMTRTKQVKLNGNRLDQKS